MLTISHIFLSKRYEIFLKSSQVFPRFSTVFSIIMVGVFYNNFLPSGAGGDVARIYYLRKKLGVQVAAGTAITVMDRIIGLLGLVFIAFLSFAYLILFQNTVLADYKYMALIITSVPVFMIVCLFLIRSERVRKYMNNILSKTVLTSKFIPMVDTAGKLLKNTHAIIMSFLLCLMGHCISLLCIGIISYTLYGLSAATTAILISGLVFLSTIIPLTPGNIGVTELFADKLFSLFGIEGGANIFAMWRLVCIAFSLIGGIIFLRIDRTR